MTVPPNAPPNAPTAPPSVDVASARLGAVIEPPRISVRPPPDIAFGEVPQAEAEERLVVLSQVRLSDRETEEEYDPAESESVEQEPEAPPDVAGWAKDGGWKSLLDSSESHQLMALLVVCASIATSVMQEQIPWALLASASLLLITWGLARRVRAIDGSTHDYLREVRGLLVGTAKRVSEEGLVSEVPFSHLRAGEEILVEADEVVGADGAVSAGVAELQPWPGAEVRRTVGVGTRVVAGARVLSGSLYLVCAKTASDRAYAQLADESGPRVERNILFSVLARIVSVRAAPLTGLLALFLLYLQGGTYADMLGMFGSVWGALAAPLPRTLTSLVALAWLVRAARRGVLYPHEALVDKAGQVTAAVFCARGTVLHGEPEVAEIHPFRGTSEAEILTLAAGAESVVYHPIAAAITRAASARGLTADICRGHHATPGQGVSCVSSLGDAVVVGSRELLLEQRVSIALAEETLRALETRGLSALLIAKNEHLIGVMALQDSLRAGSRATVQLLLDERIEPVLLSGESRATTEAVGHALACEHVRPEVPGRHRAAEVNRLRDAGATVAVVGTIPRDEAALSAASVPIILEGAAVARRDSPHAHERAIGIASGSVLASAVALVVARRIRHFGQTGLLIGYVPVVFALLCSASQLAPVYFAPAAALMSSLLLVFSSQRWIRQPLFRAEFSE